ncbi:MAG: NTF2-like N-terminal transpeptidase domain-containing protein [Actinomycetota bacterium]
MMKRAAIAFLLLALATSCLGGLGCGGADTPEQVADKFVQAMLDEDGDAAWAVVTEASKEGISKEELVEGGSEGIEGYTMGDASVAGDEARVMTSFTLTGLDKPMEFDMVLFKEGGGWKVSLADTQTEIEKSLEALLEELGIQQ